MVQQIWYRENWSLFANVRGVRENGRDAGSILKVKVEGMEKEVVCES